MRQIVADEKEIVVSWMNAIRLVSFSCKSLRDIFLLSNAYNRQ